MACLTCGTLQGMTFVELSDVSVTLRREKTDLHSTVEVYVNNHANPLQTFYGMR